jgi:hypothetical protein
VALAALVLSLSAGKIHRQMQILQSSRHLDHGLLQQVQRRSSILLLLVVEVVEAGSAAVVVLVDCELAVVIQ